MKKLLVAVILFSIARGSFAAQPLEEAIQPEAIMALQAAKTAEGVAVAEEAKAEELMFNCVCKKIEEASKEIPSEGVAPVITKKVTTEEIEVPAPEKPSEAAAEKTPAELEE